MDIGQDRGFTLIELLIVVSIIAILASVAYPAYQDQITKSKRAEGKAKLVEVAQALEKCKTLYGSYNNASCAARNTVVTGGTPPTSENDYYTVSALGGAVTDTTFTLQAVPTGFTDSECGTLRLSQTGARAQTGTGTNCW